MIYSFINVFILIYLSYIKSNSYLNLCFFLFYSAVGRPTVLGLASRAT